MMRWFWASPQTKNTLTKKIRQGIFVWGQAPPGSVVTPVPTFRYTPVGTAAKKRLHLPYPSRGDLNRDKALTI